MNPIMWENNKVSEAISAKSSHDGAGDVGTIRNGQTDADFGEKQRPQIFIIGPEGFERCDAVKFWRALRRFCFRFGRNVVGFAVPHHFQLFLRDVRQQALRQTKFCGQLPLADRCTLDERIPSR